MSEFVVWFDSSETGAPVLNNAAGSLIGVLTACLVTGFNTKSITSITVAAGVATATCAGHGYSSVFGKDLLIEGVTNFTELNGRKALTFVDTTTFRFATTAPNGTATGTITAKRDPLGWVRQFTGTNKVIYKRSDVTATSLMLRVDDTNAGVASATDARARMVETATDIDTVTGLSPTELQLSGGQFWNKGTNSTTAKAWRLFGDGKRFYFFTQVANTGAAAGHGFGDFYSLKPADGYNCLISGATTAYVGTGSPTPPIGQLPGFVAGTNAGVVARPFNQVGSGVPISFAGFTVTATGLSTGALPGYPSPIDSGLLLNPQIVISEDVGGSNFCGRGLHSGICQVLAKAPFTDMQVFDPIISLPGRKLVAVSVSISSGFGQLAIDVTGPWL